MGSVNKQNYSKKESKGNGVILWTTVCHILQNIHSVLSFLATVKFKIYPIFASQKQMKLGNLQIMAINNYMRNCTAVIFLWK